jgi:hypothetical protein
VSQKGKSLLAAEKEAKLAKEEVSRLKDKALDQGSVPKPPVPAPAK